MLEFGYYFLCILDSETKAVKAVVYDSLTIWHLGEFDPKANFAFSQTGMKEISFSNSSLNATSYLWNFGDGATSTLENPIHIYTVANTYNVTLTSNKCGISDTLTKQVIVTSTGIKYPDVLQNILLYPNPTNGILHLNINNYSNLSFEIFDIMGKEINLKLNDNTVDLTDYKNGIYFFKIYSDNNIIGNYKVIKN